MAILNTSMPEHCLFPCLPSAIFLFPVGGRMSFLEDCPFKENISTLSLNTLYYRIKWFVEWNWLPCTFCTTDQTSFLAYTKLSSCWHSLIFTCCACVCECLNIHIKHKKERGEIYVAVLCFLVFALQVF